MPGVRSIRTEYRGVVFMSTLEADWAKTLDAWHIRWMNEPEGLRLPDGQNYRCDLYLPATSTWVEVKGPHDQRLDKPALLAQACQHAPGCDTGHPVGVFERPEGVTPASCPCGFGPDFCYQLVVIARPAVGARAIWEAVHDSHQHIVLMECPRCHQRSFTDYHAIPLCRRCHGHVPGAPLYQSASKPFHRVEPPRGRSASRAAAARARQSH